MIHERTTITLKEFVKDAAEYVEEVAAGNERLLVTTKSGKVVELRSISGYAEDMISKNEDRIALPGHEYDAENSVYRSRMNREERVIHLLSFSGALSDEDAKALRRNLYESRDIPGRELNFS